ncbi:hypothetical protein CVS42_08270 [Aeromonas veronii]|uniref:hypothetical protein n=1 Tax=Aeromonas veronii TaxID=654 RepID=UPI000C29105D|nr:hypothetical protein [Aeromonas veronii]ATY80820.1 hypothetical protein CVS42_08270 [Aeromonas veronii]
MESKLKAPASWGLQHGEFFDLYTVVDLLQVTSDVASDVMHYLRCLRYVETVAETRSCKKEAGKSLRRIFIKVVAIYPEPSSKAPRAKVDVLHSKLAQLSKTMPLPQGKR